MKEILGSKLVILKTQAIRRFKHREHKQLQVYTYLGHMVISKARRESQIGVYNNHEDTMKRKQCEENNCF